MAKIRVLNPIDKKDPWHTGARDLQKLNKEVTKVQDGDLYKALHHIGDDDAKACAESKLKQLLDEDTYKLVLAVFNLSTDWKFITGRE